MRNQRAAAVLTSMGSICVLAMASQAQAAAPPAHTNYSVSITVSHKGGRIAKHQGGEVDFERMGKTYNVPLKRGQVENEGLVPGNYLVVAKVRGAVCAKKRLHVTLTSRTKTYVEKCKASK